MTNPQLHPEVSGLLAYVAELKLPDITGLTAQAARELVHSLSTNFETSDIHSVDEMQIPSADQQRQIPMRVYRPIANETLPVVVFYHGGGWVVCDLDTHEEVARRLSLQANCVVCSVDYRLAPEHPFPAAGDDAYDALCWVAEHAAQLNVDASRLALVGDSAGGNLAAVTSLRARDQQGPAVCHQSLWYPVTNIHTLDTPSYFDMSEGYNLKRGEMQYFKDHYLSDPEQAREAYVSPLLSDDLSGMPSTYVMTAHFDVLRDDGANYAKALQQAGNTVEYHCFGSLVHGFMNLAPLLPVAADAFSEAVQPIRRAFWGDA